MICNQLGLKPVPLFKLKAVCSFNGQLFKFKIIYIIYSGLLLKKDYKEATVPMLIADLKQHNIILEKL